MAEPAESQDDQVYIYASCYVLNRPKRTLGIGQMRDANRATSMMSNYFERHPKGIALFPQLQISPRQDTHNHLPASLKNELL